jgi:ABC-type multidrug transport system ATPase subunit
MELLRDVAVREDRAVMVVTHDSRVFDFADRIAYMNDGRIVRTEARASKDGRNRDSYETADERRFTPMDPEKLASIGAHRRFLPAGRYEAQPQGLDG